MTGSIATAAFAIIILLLSSIHANINAPYAFAAEDNTPVDSAVPFVQQFQVVEGSYNDAKHGFGITLPENRTGFLTQIGSGDYVTFQIHPESNFTKETCCMPIEVTPAAMLFTSAPLSTLSSPVPFTGDVFAAFQGYNMKVRIDHIDSKEVLVATLMSERNDIPGYDLVKRVGKFYLINNDERFISYGLWASEENYQKYISEFEASARSIILDNPKPVNLHSIFHQYSIQDTVVELEDGTVLRPEIITPSIVESVGVNEESKTFKIKVSEPSNNSFLMINSRDLLAGPHTVTLDGKPTESTILSNESGEYLIAFYDQAGNHEVAITGTAVVPEFPYSVLISAVAISAVMGYFVIVRTRKHGNLW